MSLTRLLGHDRPVVRRHTTKPFHGTSRGSARVRYQHISDASELETLFPVSTECIQLSQGRFAGTMFSAGLDNVSLFEHACNRGVQLRWWLDPDTLLIGYVQEGSDILEYGGTWTPEEMLVIRGGRLDLSTLSAHRIVWLQFNLRALGASESNACLYLAPGTIFYACRRSLAFEQLRDYVASVIGLCQASPLILEDEAIRRHIEVDIVTRATRALEAAQAVPMHPTRKHNSSPLVRRVERFMWENVEEPLTLGWICKSMNCRMRNLIYSFKDSFGLGPMTYLKIRRLNAARRKLKDTRGQMRIFDIAADFGFWHMGHFSADYKRMFGATASETIATARTSNGSVANLLS
jgi:AraC family ethanolamine operon transcriptional activator